MTVLSDTRKARLVARLSAAFSPTVLEITDESHLHAGHAGWSAAGETHFRIKIVAAAFAGMGRVAQHRAIYAAVQDEFDTGLHALAIEATT